MMYIKFLTLLALIVFKLECTSLFKNTIKDTPYIDITSNKLINNF